LGFGVQGVGFRVTSKVTVSSPRFAMVNSPTYRTFVSVWGLEFRDEYWGLGLRDKGLGFGDEYWGLGVRV
jgi:hypothetical protein